MHNLDSRLRGNDNITFKKSRRLQFFLYAVVFLLIGAGIVGTLYASTAYALDPLVICGRLDQAGTPDGTCQPCHLFKLLQRLMNFVLYDLMLPLATIMVLYGGILMLFGVQSANNFTNGKKILLNTFIGMCIIFIAWLGIDYTLKLLSFTPSAPFGPWNELQCSLTVSCNVPAEFQCENGTPTTVGACTFKLCDPTMAAYYAAAAAGNGYALNGSSPALSNITPGVGQNKCSTGVFGSNSAAVQQAASQWGVPPAAYAALLCTETSCGKDVRVSGAGAGGFSQVMPATACGFRSSIPGCTGKKATDENAVLQWLSNNQNAIDIGAQVYKDCLTRAGGDPALAAACYNGGTKAIEPSTKAGCEGQLAFRCLQNPGWAETRDKQVPVFTTTYQAINSGQCNPFQ